MSDYRIEAATKEEWANRALIAEAKLTKAEKDRDGYLAERNKFQLYLQRTHADWELEVAAVDALTAKLAKAVELALEECPFRAGTPKYDKWWHHRRATLAEIKGESHE